MDLMDHYSRFISAKETLKFYRLLDFSICLFWSWGQYVIIQVLFSKVKHSIIEHDFNDLFYSSASQ